MRHTFSILMAGLLTVASAAGQVSATPIRNIDQPGNSGSKVGLNVADFTYYSSEVVFMDLFRGCSEWIPQLVTGGPWNTGATIAQRVDGYPSTLAAGQAVASLINVGMGSRYPGGDYVALWDGDGDVELRWDAIEIARSANRIVCRVNPSQGILLRITRTNAANPVRNLRLVPKAYEFVYRILPFHPSFIERWRVARVLRFMDWQKTNSTYLSAWADRVQPGYYTQQGRDGAAIEHMVDLCNYLGADPWFCMPHLATDDFVRQFARLVAGRLRAGLKCHVEYSNECWNGSFVQARYC